METSPIQLAPFTSIPPHRPRQHLVEAMIPVRITYHNAIWPSLLIEARWFRSEIVWIPSQRWTRPHIREWSPSWHELDLGKFSIDFSRENRYDEPHD